MGDKIISLQKIGFLKRRTKSALYLNVPFVAGVATQVITLPLILANLPVEDYGLYQFVLALEIWLAIFTVPQIGFGAKRGIVRGLEGTLLFAYFVRLRLCAGITALVWLAAFVLLQVTSYETLGILLLMLGAFLPLGVLSQATWKQFFVAKKQFGQFAFWRMLGLVASPVAGTIAAVYTHNVLVFAAAHFAVATLLSLAAFGYILRKHPLWQAYKQGQIDRAVVPYGFRLLPASFAMSVADKGGALIVGPLFGFANLAVFSLADKLGSIFNNLLHSTNHLLYADFAKLSWEVLVGKVKTYILFGLASAAGVSVLFAAAGYLYIHFFMPEVYQPAKLYLLILTVGFPALALRGALQAVLETNFKTKEILIVSLVPNAFRLCFMIGGGLVFGLTGLLWGLAGAAWIEFAFYCFLIMRPKNVRILSLFRL